MDKQSYAFSQIFIKSYLLRQAPASFNVYFPERGKVQLNNQVTQAAHNIDTLLPLNRSNGPGNVLFAPHFVLSMQSRLVFWGIANVC